MNDDEWDHRTLCPNGACNGLIGDDGTCKVCGHVMPNWGDERMRGLSDEQASDEDEDDDDLEDEDENENDDELDEDDDDDDDGAAPGSEQPAAWDDRKLCDDGACVGVIGSDGLCTVCGKRSAA